MSTSPFPAARSQSLRDFRRGWVTSERTQELGWWIEWPPDVFALTSVLLERTGAYRRGVKPTVAEFGPGARPTGDARPIHPTGWEDRAAEAAVAWREWVLGRGAALDPWMKDHLDVFGELESRVTLDELGASTLGNDARRALRAVLSLHAVSDLTCRGFGIVSSESARGSLIHGLASLLLVIKGSLSRIPKHQGVVLPKTRTPQSGLTLRSFSHHLSFHASEVDVVWRSIPWMSRPVRELSIMLVPWPFEVRPEWFESHGEGPIPNVGYFSFRPDATGDLDPQFVLDLIESASRTPDILVFPELSLTEEDLADLQDALTAELDPNEVPMLVAGVRSPSKTSADVGDSPIENGVVFSTHFAGKWYRLVQHKHHRWKMDARQIRQYRIGSALSPTTDDPRDGKERQGEGAHAKSLEGTAGEEMVWWEGFRVRRRQISFLAPNAWLNLCPLVCEDLAQFEPVSDVIRGVGPTLLIALLLDGPQLEVRWPSRYATVMAADPGSAVLTLTSLGMAQRSLRRPGDTPSRVIALWRDAEGPVEIRLWKNAHAVLLNVQGEFTEEFTADGRSDEGWAPRFRLPRVDGTYRPEQVRLKRQHEPAGRSTQPAAPREAWTFTDMRELSTATFLIDVALEADDEVLETLKAWAQGFRSDVPVEHRRGAALVEVFEEVLAHQVPDRMYWKGGRRTEWVGRDLRFGVAVFSELVHEARSGWEGSLEDRRAWWSRVLSVAEQWLEEGRRVGGSFHGLPREERRRIERAIPEAVAWAVHNRLLATVSREEPGMDESVETEFERVELVVKRAAEVPADG